jgi:hypothetical protein
MSAFQKIRVNKLGILPTLTVGERKMILNAETKESEEKLTGFIGFQCLGLALLIKVHISFILLEILNAVKYIQLNKNTLLCCKMHQQKKVDISTILKSGVL